MSLVNKTDRSIAARLLIAAFAADLLVTLAAPRSAYPQVGADILPLATFSEAASAVNASDFKTGPGTANASGTLSVPGFPASSGASSASTAPALHLHSLVGLDAFADGQVHNSAGESIATIQFSLEAVEFSTPPGGFGGFIPVDVEGTVSASASNIGLSPNGTAITVSTMASFSLLRQESASVLCAPGGVPCKALQVDGQSFSQSSGTLNASTSLAYSFEIGLDPFQVVTGELDASGRMDLSGDLVQGSALNATYSAMADPTIVIDPNFPFRDDFELLVSPNLFAAPTPGPSAVPEPPTLPLIIAGIGALALARLRLIILA